MIGAYVGYTANKIFGLPMWITFFITILSCILVGFLAEKIVLRKLAAADRIQILFATAVIGVIILPNAAQIIWGTEPHIFPPYLKDSTIEFFGLLIKPQQIAIAIATILLFILLYFFLNFTKMGKVMRAVACNQKAARLMGISINKVQSISFSLASAYAGIAGLLIAPLYVVDFSMGNPMTVKIFSAAVLGGLESIPGAVVGSILIGITENLSGFYISTAYKDVITFLILAFVLILKPSGIFGKNSIEKV